MSGPCRDHVRKAVSLAASWFETRNSAALLTMRGERLAFIFA